MTSTNIKSALGGRIDIAHFARSALKSRFLAVLLLLVVLFVFFSLTQDAFLTSANLDSLLTGVSILFVVAIGMTFVMLSGGFDISAGSVLALCGIVLGMLYTDVGLPIGVAILLTLLLGALLGGGINGYLIGRVGISFLVVTLGTFILFRGALNLLSDGETTQVTSGFLDGLAFDKFLGLPVPVWIMVVIFLLARYVLRGTFFGRDVYAVGGSPDAARLSGIKVARTIIIVYGIAGLLAALAGIIQTARVGAASPLVGETIIFDAGAAVLIGGTSFHGGIGGVTGTVVGVLFLGVLQNGLAVSGVQSFWQQVITGAILIIAMVIDRIQREGWASLGYRLPRFKRRREPSLGPPSGSMDAG